MSTFMSDRLHPSKSPPPSGYSPNATLHVRRSADFNHSGQPQTLNPPSQGPRNSRQSPPSQAPQHSSLAASPRIGRMSIGSLLSSGESHWKSQATNASQPFPVATRLSEGPGAESDSFKALHSRETSHTDQQNIRLSSAYAGDLVKQSQSTNGLGPAEFSSRPPRLQGRPVDTMHDGFATPGAPIRSAYGSNGNNPPARDRHRTPAERATAEARSTSPRFSRHASVPAPSQTKGAMYSPAAAADFGYGPSGPPPPPVWMRSQYPGSGSLMGYSSNESASTPMMGNGRYLPDNLPPTYPEIAPMSGVADYRDTEEYNGRKRSSPEEYMHRRNDHYGGSRRSMDTGASRIMFEPSLAGNDNDRESFEGNPSMGYGSELGSAMYTSNGYDHYPEYNPARSSRGAQGEVKRRERTMSMSERNAREGGYAGAAAAAAAAAAPAANSSRRKPAQGRSGAGEKKQSAAHRNLVPLSRGSEQGLSRVAKTNGATHASAPEMVVEEAQIQAPEVIAVNHRVSSTSPVKTAVLVQDIPTAVPSSHAIYSGYPLQSHVLSGTSSKREDPLLATTEPVKKFEISDLASMHHWGETKIDNTAIDEALRHVSDQLNSSGDVNTGQEDGLRGVRVEEYLGTLTYTPQLKLPTFGPSDVGRLCNILIPGRYVSMDNEAILTRNLWGSGVYTDDSDIVAILHHQALIPAESGSSDSSAKVSGSTKDDLRVVIRVAPKLVRYTGTNMNNIVSRDWGQNHDGQSIVIDQVQTISQKGDCVPSARKTLKRRMNAYLRERRAVFEGGCAFDPYYRLQMTIAPL